jgi:hypothetical protein
VLVTDLVVINRFFVDMERSKVFNILPLVAMCRVSMMVFMGPMEWWWSSKCCVNLDLVCVVAEPHSERSSSLSDVCFVAVEASQSVYSGHLVFVSGVVVSV